MEIDRPIIQVSVTKMIYFRSDKFFPNNHAIDVNNFIRKKEVLNTHTYTTDQELITIVTYKALQPSLGGE